MQILLWIIIMLEILSWFILADVILSLLQVLLRKALRPKFIADIIDPMYKLVKNIVPTNIWPLDFTPMIAIFMIIFIKWALFIIFPELYNNYSLL